MSSKTPPKHNQALPKHYQARTAMMMMMMMMVEPVSQLGVVTSNFNEGHMGRDDESSPGPSPSLCRGLVDHHPQAWSTEAK